MPLNSVYDPDADERPRHLQPADDYDPQTTPADDPSDPRSEYDPQRTPVGDSSDPRGDLSRAEQGSLYNPNGDRQKSSDAGSLAAAEGIGSSVGQLAKDFTPEGAALNLAGRARNMFFGTKRRRNTTLGGGAAAGGVTVLLVLLGVASGPAQILQLDQMLQRGMNPTNHAMQNRLQKIIKKAYDKHRNTAADKDTVLGEEGAADFGPASEELAANGITFNEDGSATIDVKALANKYPELSDMKTTEEQRSFLTDKFSLGSNDISQIRTGGRYFTINSPPDTFVGTAEGLLTGDNTASILESGEVVSSLGARIFTKLLGTSKLFSPDYKSASNEANTTTSVGEEVKSVQNEEETVRAPAESGLGIPGVDVNSEVKGASQSPTKVGFLGLLSADGLGTGAGCTIISISKDINDINRFRIELPSIAMGLNIIAMGDKIKYGQSVSASEVNSLEESFVNSQGQNLWQGQALQALSGNSNPGGYNLSTDYRQAFTGSSTAAGMGAYGNSLLNGTIIGSILGTSACNTFVQAGLAVTGAGVSVAGAVLTDGATVGAEAAGEVGAGAGADLAGEAAVQAGESASGTLSASDAGAAAATDVNNPASTISSRALNAMKKEAVGQIKGFVISAVGMHFIDNFLLNKYTLGKLAVDAFSGPTGGNLLAYGARAAGNAAAITDGGSQESGTESSTQMADIYKQQAQQFRSESFLARMFDINDFRSVAGRLAEDISPSFTKNVASLATGFMDIGRGLLSSLASIFIPHSSADSSYYWGIQETGQAMPQYGIPDSILNGENTSGQIDPTLADPYLNAQYVANLLNNCTQSGSNLNSCTPDWVGEVKMCFGDVISDTSGTWNVVASQNPADMVNVDQDVADGGSYNPAICGDFSNNDWRHMVLFVLDSRTMESADCYESNGTTSDKSCSDIGVDNSSAGSSGSTVSNGSLPTGTAQNLAKQIQSNQNIKLTGRDVSQDIQDAANGQPSTAGKPLSQTLLSLLVYIGQNHTFTISALESGGTGHSNSPNDPHYNGDAVDITGLDGDPIANSGIGRTTHDQALITEIAPLLPTTAGIGGSQSGFGQSECGTTPPLPKGVITFSDTCDHLHIQIPVGSP